MNHPTQPLVEQPPAEPGPAAATAVPTPVPDTIGTEAATDLIPTLRGQIDALDEAITRLVAERSRVSARIQTARINAGGTRVELGRERLIRDGYRGALGPDGAQLADAILRVCRGAH